MSKPKNRSVSKTVLTVTMLHPAELDPAKMSNDDIAYHLGDGEFVGERTAIETNPVADEDVLAELQALGNDGTFFELEAVEDTPLGRLIGKRDGEYSPAVQVLSLYVPADGQLTHIKKGSALVGVPMEGDDVARVRCYYEGGVYSESPFSDYISIAAGRLADRAPTVALGYFEEDDLIRVGTVAWDPALGSWIITEITDFEALSEWTDNVPDIGGTRDQLERACGRAVSGGDVEAMTVYSTAAKSNQDPVVALVAHLREQRPLQDAAV